MRSAQLLTMAEACRALGQGRRTLTYYVAQGCPVTKGKGGRLLFDKAQVLDWMLASGKSGRRGTPTPGGLPAGDEHAQSVARVDLRIRELEIQKRGRLEAQARGDLLLGLDVEEAWAAEGLRVKAMVEALPARLAPSLVGLDRKGIKAALEAAVDGLLASMPERAPGLKPV